METRRDRLLLRPLRMLSIKGALLDLDGLVNSDGDSDLESDASNPDIAKVAVILGEPALACAVFSFLEGHLSFAHRILSRSIRQLLEQMPLRLRTSDGKTSHRISSYLDGALKRGASLASFPFVRLRGAHLRSVSDGQAALIANLIRAGIFRMSDELGLQFATVGTQLGIELIVDAL